MTSLGKSGRGNNVNVSYYAMSLKISNVLRCVLVLCGCDSLNGCNNVFCVFILNS